MMSSSPSSTPNTLLSAGVTGGMDVDQDVAGWLDSLIPNQSPQGQQNGSAHDSGIAEMNGNNESMTMNTPQMGKPVGNYQQQGYHNKNISNNNMMQAVQNASPLNAMIGGAVHNDSILDDSDMIMSALQSPLSLIHHNPLPDNMME